jgi:MOSC domain-containing protein YiiM
MENPRIASVHVGKIAPLGPDGVHSAFVKRRTPGPVTVTTFGIVGDEQADLSVHGGADKAVYGYGVPNYAAWVQEHPRHAALLVPGGLGENLAIEGMTEADLCVGDIHGIGSAKLQVCQPRQPCFKFALRFADKHMPKAMIRNGRSGWYYRILEPGLLSPGDAVTLLERPNPHFPFARLVELISFGKATAGELQQMRDMPGLAVDWQLRARDVLSRHV